MSDENIKILKAVLKDGQVPESATHDSTVFLESICFQEKANIAPPVKQKLATESVQKEKKSDK